jgi:Flp pilus assembly protein TadB
MEREKYGANFQEHLLEQYKLYVEMADRISARRAQSNRFYISLLSALLALLSILINRTLWSSIQNAIFLAVAILGLALCFLWYVNINSYRQLNSGKFKVIQELEQHLPFNCYG